MKKNYLLLILTITLIFSSGSFVLADEPAFVILHTNDFHGYLLPFLDKEFTQPPDKIGGSAYLATVIKQQIKEFKGKTIVVDAGDMFQGTALSNEYKGLSVIEINNKIGYHVWTLGNHEFDWGLSITETLIKKASFSCVSSNIVYKKNGLPLKNTVPYLIKEINGVKIGILGLTTPTATYISNPAATGQLIFINEVKAVKKYLPVLKNKGAEVILVISHLGKKEDVKLAQDVPQIDIIVGGHSHTAVKKPILVNNKTIIVQAGSYGRYLGQLIVYYDRKTKKIDFTKTKGQLIPIINKDIQPDPEISAIINNYKKNLDQWMNKIIGSTEIDLTRNYDKDSVLGNLITDAILNYSKADIAFHNSGGIRKDIYKGQITVGSVYEVLPFDNVVVLLEMKGRRIMEILEHSASLEQGIMQVSGLTMWYDRKRPVGSRVVKVIVGKEPLDLDKTYKVATINFLVSGGDGYVAFAKGKILKSSDLLLRDIFLKYVEKNSPIKTMPVMERIIEKN